MNCKNVGKQIVLINILEQVTHVTLDTSEQKKEHLKMGSVRFRSTHVLMSISMQNGIWRQHARSAYFHGGQICSHTSVIYPKYLLENVVDFYLWYFVLVSLSTFMYRS